LHCYEGRTSLDHQLQRNGGALVVTEWYVKNLKSLEFV